MDIMELGAIGELVGGVAVIGSLIYLGLQVRQSNAIAKDHSARAFNETVFDLTSAIVADRQLAEVWFQGGNGFDDLDEVDRERMILFERRGFDLCHLAWQQRKRGILDESDWKKARATIETIGGRQSIRESWKVFRNFYDGEFQKLMDPYVGGVQ